MISQFGGIPELFFSPKSSNTLSSNGWSLLFNMLLVDKIVYQACWFKYLVVKWVKLLLPELVQSKTIRNVTDYEENEGGEDEENDYEQMERETMESRSVVVTDDYNNDEHESRTNLSGVRVYSGIPSLLYWSRGNVGSFF